MLEDRRGERSGEKRRVEIKGQDRGGELPHEGLVLLWVYIEGARGVQVRVGAGIGARGWGGEGVEVSSGAGVVVCVGQSV